MKTLRAAINVAVLFIPGFLGRLVHLATELKTQKHEEVTENNVTTEED
jgi:hypothetical protein